MQSAALQLRRIWGWRRHLSPWVIIIFVGRGNTKAHGTLPYFRVCMNKLRFSIVQTGFGAMPKHTASAFSKPRAACPALNSETKDLPFESLRGSQVDLPAQSSQGSQEIAKRQWGARRRARERNSEEHGVAHLCHARSSREGQARAHSKREMRDHLLAAHRETRSPPPHAGGGSRVCAFRGERAREHICFSTLSLGTSHVHTNVDRETGG